jgi:phosphate transport system ATP-binding protein
MAQEKKAKFSIRGLHVWFGGIQSLRGITMDIPAHEILSVIGPANSGKTTFLRMLNRLNELQLNFRMQGRVMIDEKDIMRIGVELLRRKIGMVFALPAPLPLSIFDNVAYGVKMQGITNRRQQEEKVERALQQAVLWEEVKDRMGESAFKLSGGQQQRLCIARTLAVEPEVILFDEPCSGLDPISTAKVEETMVKLKEEYTMVLVTNNVKQAARVGDKTAFFLSGELIEMDRTDKIFTSPSDKRTDDYISGKFG